MRSEAAYRLRRISIFTFGLNSVSLSMCIIYIFWALHQNAKRTPGTSSWELYKYFVFHVFNMVNLAAIIFNIIGKLKSNSKFIVAYIYANACYLVMAVFFLLSLFLMGKSLVCTWNIQWRNLLPRSKFSSQNMIKLHFFLQDPGKTSNNLNERFRCYPSPFGNLINSSITNLQHCNVPIQHRKKHFTTVSALAIISWL